ncbi:non-ribosomal peptide synthetase [Bacillus cereus]|uniref:non-ribosomal peptide synthetase n=1 Tax=Bacillus cereus TaxID=1396 RepID=UPI000BF86F9A|nr:non-ribosomal peptide synthetase [Bacillus cereus]PFD48734.1 hypothetical protein CN281_11290 [Bacillus cereus]PFH95735.1 hypothetical protein COI78_08610 [Bacillus cereus]
MYNVEKDLSVIDTKLDKSSNFQKQMWTLQMLNPKSAAYNVYEAYIIKEGFNQEKFISSLRKVHRNNDILQMKFIEVNEEIYAKKEFENKIHLKIVDDPFGSTEDILEEIEKENAIPFDLEKDVLYKVIIYKYSQNKTIIYFKFHHILIDEDGFSVYLQELFDSYLGINNEFDNDKKSSYFEIIKDQSIDSSRIREAWFKKLKGANYNITWPIIETKNLNEKVHQFQVSNEVKERVLKFSTEKRKSTYVTLLSAFIVSIFKYTKESNFTIGTPISGRLSEEQFRSVGPFSNTIPVCISLDNIEYINQILDKVSEEYYFILDNRNISSQELVNELSILNRHTESSLYNIIFTEVKSKVNYSEYAIDKLELFPNTNKFDLSFFYELTSEGIKFSFEIDNNIFDKNGIHSIQRYFLDALEKLIMEDKPKLYLPSGNINYHNEYSNKKILIEEFEHAAMSYSNEIAITYQGKDYTYAELANLVNNLSKNLLANGVKESSYVGLYMDRGIQSIVSLLALLKLKCIYVPLDKKLPQDRITYICLNSGISSILIDSIIDFEDEIDIALNTININQIWDSEVPNLELNLHYDHSDKLYLMYTSGSTGRPKGITITNQNISPFLEWNKDYFKFSNRDRNIQYHNLSFDFSIWEIFETLLTGGCLYVMDDKTAVNAEDFLDFISEHKITVVNLTPSQIMHMIDYIEAFNKDLTSLRTIVLGGEQLTTNLAKRIRNVVSDKCKIFNEYGPTEATISSSIFEYNDDITTESVPIGKPTSNFVFKIFDENFKEVNKGELFITGDGVSEGYRKNPLETRKRFIEIDGIVYYKTGDFVERLESGDYLFIGREDNQIKFHGYRIELSEVEKEIFDITKAVHCKVVMKQLDDSQLDYLSAFVVLGKEKEFSESMIVEELKRRLPHYMIPSEINFLTDFQITANGKFDNKSLIKDEYENRRKQIIDIFKNILKVNQIKPTDNFFGLGGDSIRAIKVSVEAKKIGLDMKTSAIFETPIIYELIDTLESVNNKHKSIVENVQMHQFEEYPLSDIQQGMLWETLTNKSKGVYHQQMIVTIDSKINKDILVESILTTLNEYRVLNNKVYFNENEVPVQKSVIDDDKIIEVYEGESLSLDEIIEKDFNSPFTFPSSYLIRFYILNKKDSTNLVISYHHMLLDGWSSSFVLSQIFNHYNDFIQGKEIQLDINDQFREYLNKNRTNQKGLEFWRNYIEDIPEKPKVENENFNMAKTESIYLEDNVTEGILEYAKRKNVSPNVVFLSIYLKLTHEENRDDLTVVGVTNSGRQNLEMEELNLVGCLLNTLPMKVDFKQISTFDELLGEVQKYLTNLVKHGDVSLNSILKSSKRSVRSNSEIFSDIFVFQNYPIGNGLFNKIGISDIGYRAGINYNSSFIVSLNNKTEIGFMFNDEIERPKIQSFLEKFQENIHKMIEDKLEVNNSNHNEIAIEEIVKSAWKDILQVDNLKLSDNFFDLGGDSISSLRIALRLKKSNIHISPTTIFSNQTIEELVNHILEVNTGFSSLK